MGQALLSLLPGTVLVGLVWLGIGLRRGWPVLGLLYVLVVWGGFVATGMAMFWGYTGLSFWFLPLAPLCALLAAGGLVIHLGHRTGWWLLASAPVLYVPIYVGIQYLVDGRF